MQRRNSGNRSGRTNAPARRPAAWRALLALLALGLAAGACSNDLTGIGVGLPSSQTNTGAYLLDTITVRTSTVLRDSLVTSTSGFLLVGRATDPVLGTLTATSAFRLGVPADNFKIDNTFVYDSVVLVLPTDTYRFGDTTRTQSLFEVHPLRTLLLANKPLFASPKLTTVDADPALVLNKGGAAAVPVRRARLRLGTLRLRLDDATFGPALLAAGQSGRYQTQDLFDTYLPGLALLPAPADNAALVRLSATNGAAALVLYYHDPTNVGTALNFSFGIGSGNRHVYQLMADRSTAPANAQALPTRSLQAVAASLTGQQTVVQGVLGLQTKLDFPYLTDLLQLGNHLTITNAQLTAQVPTGTLSPVVPAPPTLVVSGANILNQPVGNYVAGVPYVLTQSPLTGLDQGSYTFTMTSYIQAVLARTLPNNGLLLSSATPDLPNRVVLGSPANAANKLQLRVYLIQVQ